MTAVWIALLAVFIALIPAISLGLKKSSEAKAAKARKSADDGGVGYLPIVSDTGHTREPGSHGHLTHAHHAHGDKSPSDDASSTDGGGDGGGGGGSD